MSDSTGSQDYGLSAEKLRTFKGMENLTDEEAESIISTFRKFSLLTFKLFRYVKEANRTEQDK